MKKQKVKNTYSKMNKENEEASPFVKSLRGNFEMSEAFDYKKDLAELLSKKYYQ